MSILSAVLAASAAMTPGLESFDAKTSLPDGWRTGVTGHGTAKWEVLRDEAAPTPPHVLRQSGEATYCWAVASQARVRNGFAEVKFKPVSGNEDQAAGLVWRFKDADNYYVVRANALEGNLVLYKTVNGKRSSLQVKGRMFGYGVDANVPKGRWSTLRVEFADTLFTVLLDGQRLFQVEDGTLQEAGAVGVWTKADSVTAFDDFQFASQ